MARVSFRKPNSPQPADGLLTRWLDALDPRPAIEHIDVAAADLVETLTGRPQELPAALARFGRHMGAHGWSMTDLAAWTDQLAEVAGPYAAPLRQFDAGIALGQGWADGFLHGLRDDGCTDALTGLATLPVLGIRLRQVADQCRNLGIAAHQAFIVFVIDPDLHARTPLVRDAARVVMADRVARTFRGGETVAVSGNRIVVLVSRTPELEVTVDRLMAELRHLPVLDGVSLLSWLEELPEDTSTIDRFLIDLAGT